MRLPDIIVSLSVHAALLGAVAGLSRQATPPCEEGTVPIFFELVTPSSEGTVPTDSGTVPTDLNPSSEGTVPTDSGTVPIQNSGRNMGTLPSQIGSVPNFYGGKLAENAENLVENEVSETVSVGTVPVELGTVPVTAVGTVPVELGTVPVARVGTDPVALNRVTPVYPRSARRKGHEGAVAIDVLVAEDGSVSGVGLFASSGHPELDAAALEAARTARFAPATEDGAAVCGRIRMAFDFKLE